MGLLIETISSLSVPFGPQRIPLWNCQGMEMKLKTLLQICIDDSEQRHAKGKIIKWQEKSSSSPIFNRDLNTRWLTLVSAYKKVEEGWETPKTYFLDFLLKEQSFKATSKNEKYIRICHSLRNETRILIHMAFVVGISLPTVVII